MKLHPMVRLANLVGRIATPIFFAGVICGVFKLYMPPSSLESVFGKIALGCGIYILLHITLMVIAFRLSKPIDQ